MTIDLSDRQTLSRFHCIATPSLIGWHSIVYARKVGGKTLKIHIGVIITGLLSHVRALTAWVNHRYYGLGFQSDEIS